MVHTDFDVIVLGAGPAGLTSGIYLARSKAKVLLVDSSIPGGQTVLTHEIANYPGIETISGYMLASTMKKQAESFGCTIKSNVQVVQIDLQGEVKSISLKSGEKFTAKAVILATGGRSKMIGVKGEKAYKGQGISYCATCDGDFFQDREIIVVGGGNSALEEAVSLTKYASKVTIVHMLDQWQAFDYAIEEMEANDKIDYLLGSRIIEFKGEGALKEVIIEDIKHKKTYSKKIDGVFIFIGYEANTEFLTDKEVALSDRKEILVDKNMQTNVEGVFAAGDALQKKYRQVTTAVSDGTIAALSALEFIHKK
ncbi:MAG: pyridine nucleotide-disulfide oxidoreductase [Bacteroidetes bacterium 4572_77]|nr:MAG: pyridine nucleotide-disulfide oxidoreductase [Bacteroidetes bacterium 4572_77]